MNLLAYFLLLFTHISFAVATGQKKTYRLQILHNNDLHSKFAETDENSAPCPQGYVEKNKCYGGFARIKWAADDAREKANKEGIPSIFLNAGDNFSGTPYYDIFKWRIVKDLIDQLGLDAMVLGNHEFDDDIEGLVEFLKAIETPVVCANLDITNEPKLKLPKLTPSTILKRTFGEEEIKIGVIGYLTRDTKGRKTGKLDLTEIIPAVQAEAQRLRKDENVKFIVALGHVGFDEDIKIAKSIKEINLVVSGDSHTLLYTPKNEAPSIEDVTAEYPEVVKVEKKEKEVMVPVVQAYAYGKYLGILEVEFDHEGNVIDYTGNTLLLDSKIEKDTHLENEVNKWTKKLVEEIPDFKNVKGYTRTFLKKPKYNEGRFECNFANFITDTFVDYSMQLAQQRNEKTWTKTPISFFPGGGIRIDIANDRSKGALTVEDLMTIMPFQNDMYELTVRGSTIRKFLELSVSLFNKDEYEFDGKHYIHFSGLRVEFDLMKPVNHRVASVHAFCRKCNIPKFDPLEDNADYGIITPITEVKKFKMIQTENQPDEELVKAYQETLLIFKDLHPVKDFLERTKVVAPILDKRVIVTGFELKKRVSSI